MDDLISKLSEIRSEYNCFSADEEPYYRALSEAIRILSQRVDGNTISRQAAIDAIAKQMPKSYTLDGSHPGDEEIYKIQEIYVDCIESIEILPAVQPDHTADISKKVADEDCISRQWLMECVSEGWIKFDTKKDENRFMHLVRDIAPSAQPEPQWTPCSERLPDNYDYQLLTEEVHYTTGKIVRCVLIAYYDDEDDVWMSAEESPEAISYPIAWMPLPEPYRGGEME